MNKGKFPHDKKQQKHPFQGGNKPQWPGQNPNQNPSHNPSEGHGPSKPQWPGNKDKR